MRAQIFQDDYSDVKPGAHEGKKRQTRNFDNEIRTNTYRLYDETEGYTRFRSPRKPII